MSSDWRLALHTTLLIHASGNECQIYKQYNFRKYMPLLNSTFLSSTLVLSLQDLASNIQKSEYYFKALTGIQNIVLKIAFYLWQQVFDHLERNVLNIDASIPVHAGTCQLLEDSVYITMSVTARTRPTLLAGIDVRLFT